MDQWTTTTLQQIPRWWNEKTTFTVLARHYAEDAALTPDNVERYVAAMKEHGYGDETLKQYAERHDSDVGSVYDFHAYEGLWGREADYYTTEQVARHVLKRLYFDPRLTSRRGMHSFRLRASLTWLVEHCDDNEVRVCAQAAKRAMDRLLSDELAAVLLAIAGAEADFTLNESHLKSDQPDLPDGWAFATMSSLVRLSARTVFGRCRIVVRFRDWRWSPPVVARSLTTSQCPRSLPER